MSLKKRMIRSNLAMLAAAFVILLAATCGVALLFKGKFSREMEFLEYTQLNENVVTIAGLMDQAGQTDDETLAENLGAYGYRLVVIEDGKAVYGSGREDAKEILNHFNFNAHREEETEVYYSQGMTIVGRHLTSTNTYFFAIDGEETTWWITPIRHSLSTFFYALCVLGVITAAALLFLSVFFTRRMLRKIIMPLEALEKGADRIQQGELSIPVMYHGDEEFEKVCRTFNEMRRILENLLENSMKYSGNIPVKIDVNIDQTEKSVCLEWADHGVGVPKDKIGKIFDKFYRCDESRSKKGSGVGLYLVK